MSARFWFGLVLGCCLFSPLSSAQIVPGQDWAATTPLAAGWSADLVEQARGFGEKAGTAAFMVIQHGVVVASWGDTDRRMELHSMRKSLLSALIGTAVAEGRIRLDSTLADLRIDDNAPSLTEAEKQATVLDLIEARSGVYHPALYATDGQRNKRPARGSHAPGSFWFYNNWDFNALGTIYENAVGHSIFDELQTRIATPLGMQDYRPSDGRYVTGHDDRGTRPVVSELRAYPLRMTARDLARFGLLFLHDGKWGDRQVIPAAWVADSTRPRSDTGAQAGYGYMWWTGQPPAGPALRMDLPSGAYWAEGHYGQAIAVDPADDLVIVHLTDGAHVSARQIGHMIWLILRAAHSPNAGMDPLTAARRR